MDIENKNAGYSFDLIHEEVASSDLFPDATHENTASTILQLISSSDKGITIGIEGGWGSGKSTVVHLLKQKIENNEDKETLFFIFDAWAHEGDPLRRIFLESLIKEIDPDSVDATLKKLLKEISSRTKTVEVKTERKASKLGHRLFLSTLFLPIGAAVLSGVNYSDFVWPWYTGKIGINKAFLLGLFLSVIPFVTLIHWWFFGDKDENNNTKWDFMESDSVENYTQDITEEGERTSIEFEQYFEKILEYVLGSDSTKKYQRAILVIDNLDRVASEHAASIWSTLQTFFQHRSRLSGTSPDWMRCLWFLVPYDREGLARIWDVMQDSEDANNTQNLSRSFLSKSFQVVAEVPTPVLSAWYDYCERCIKKSIKQWPTSDRKLVLDTYQRYGSKLEISPTPRQIHNFVNKVGLLGMRWGGIMSAEAMALYAILRQEFTESELRQHLLDRGLPKGYEAIGDSEVIKMQLSGMLFGVTKEKGIELLIGPEIKNALANGDGETIENLVNQHGEAFWIVWNAIKREITITTSHTEDYRISTTIAMCDGMYKYRDRLEREIGSLEEIWRSTEDKWELSKLDYVNALRKMAELSLDKENFINWSRVIIFKKLKKFVDALPSDREANSYIVQFSGLEAFLSENHAALKPFHYGSVDANKWKAWVNFLQESNVLITSVLPKKGVISELSGALLTNPNTTAKDVVGTLLATMDIYSDSDEWNDIATQIVAWANTPNRELGDSQACELMLRICLCCKDNISTQIKSSIAGNAFWKRGNSEDITTLKVLPILTACAVGKNLQSNDHVSTTIKEYWSNESLDENEKTYIIEALEKLNGFNIIWDLASDKVNKLAVSLIKENVGNKELYSQRSAIENLNNYTWANNDDFADVIYQISANSYIGEVLSDIKSDPLEFGYGLFLLKKYGIKSSKKFVKEIVESLSEEYWVKCFNTDSYILNIALENDVSLDHKYTNAFFNHFTKSIENDISTEWIWSNFDGLLDKTLDTELQLGKLEEFYFSLDADTLSDKAFDSLSGHFIANLDNQDSTDLMGRLCYWIDNSYWDRVKWLSESRYRLKVDPLESLSSRINSCAKEEPEGLDENVINGLAQMFNVKIDTEITRDEQHP